MIRMTMKITMRMSVTNSVYGVIIMMMIMMMCDRSVPPVHTLWCDSVGFKGHFPLGGIFRAERHFLLFKDQLAESGLQKTKGNMIPRGKFPLVKNGPNDKLLFPCSSKAFSSITYDFE